MRHSAEGTRAIVERAPPGRPWWIGKLTQRKCEEKLRWSGTAMQVGNIDRIRQGVNSLFNTWSCPGTARSTRSSSCSARDRSVPAKAPACSAGGWWYPKEICARRAIFDEPIKASSIPWRSFIVLYGPHVAVAAYWVYHDGVSPCLVRSVKSPLCPSASKTGQHVLGERHGAHRRNLSASDGRPCIGHIERPSRRGG